MAWKYTFEAMPSKPRSEEAIGTTLSESRELICAIDNSILLMLHANLFFDLSSNESACSTS